MLSSFFGLLALVLACIGLYGVMFYSVVRRTNEIGIRVALGAAQRDMLRLVLQETMILVALGIGIGLPVALASTRLIRNQLFGLEPNDPFTICAATLIMLAVSAFAGYLPARRASRVDPMVALRHE
jgi:ABC-type antimicrobial peptide transport system permease subunit